MADFIDNVPVATVVAEVVHTNAEHIVDYKPGFLVKELDTRRFLTAHHWPQGLQDVVVRGLKRFPLRFVIVDDSGSMLEPDGSMLVKSAAGYNIVPASRWEELRSALKFHIDLVMNSGTQAEFRFLNAANPVLVSPENPDSPNIIKALLEDGPGGGTPLCAVIRKVIISLQAHEATLKAAGQRACIIIATDGLSSDGDIIEAMAPLQQLPCWIVVRLCTNEESIVQYWSEIDKKLELEIDVLDDLRGEAQEIRAKNPWFHYGEALHRVREFGIPVKEVDLLDERSLVGTQARVIAHTIYGGNLDSYPHPDADPNGFVAFVRNKQEGIPLIYDAITQTMEPWISPELITSSH